jgi:hypothetical protein
MSAANLAADVDARLGIATRTSERRLWRTIGDADLLQSEDMGAGISAGAR